MTASIMSSPLATPVPDAALDELVHRLAPVMPEPEILVNWPVMKQILAMKAAQGAVIVAHNYQVPLITAGVADFVGDSLAMASYASTSKAPTIVVCGVHFMAETVKLLCPEKRVLLPNLNARCSLADSITAHYVRALRTAYPDLPVVAYVNTSAAVKAEADICCTSANAVDVAHHLAVPRIIMVPDRHLAGYVARKTGIEVVSSGGECEVHAKFSGIEISEFRRDLHATVLAHPECSEDVQRRADFVGSTSAMIQYLREWRPRQVLLLTECSMADNISIELPDIEFLRPCNLCSYMKSITIFGIARSLKDGSYDIQIAPEIAVRARRAVRRMLDV
jgi:quinolinate synthase